MELLIQVISRYSEDVDIDFGCFKRGDVIVAQPDHWAWSPMELKRAEWCIIKVPDMKHGDGEAICAKEPAVIPFFSQVLRQRGAYINLDHSGMPRDLFQLMTDASRKIPIIIHPWLTLGNILSVRTIKTGDVDPNTMGPSSNIIG